MTRQTQATTQMLAFAVLVFIVVAGFFGYLAGIQLGHAGVTSSAATTYTTTVGMVVSLLQAPTTTSTASTTTTLTRTSYQVNQGGA
ncbi:MAG: hypothetical protein ACRDF4_06275, partial [Rhabdochlamydiaceae bacterium]